MRRASALVLALVVGVTACSSGPPALPTPPPFALPSFPTPDPVGVPGSVAPGEPPDGGAAQAMAPMPPDIVAAVDVLVDAGSSAERVAATEALLGAIGVEVTGDEAAAAQRAAGIVLAPEEVEIIAAEAATGQHRATLADFAETFGGAALLPPNDALAADLPDGWLDSEAPLGEPDANYAGNLDLGPLPARLSTLVTDWVTSAIELHGSSDPTLVELTTAPLLLTELARRRDPSLDLAQPFAAADLRMGWLEMTVLIAGMRAMLAGAEAAGIAAAPSDAGSIVLAAHRTPASVTEAPPAEPTPCDTLKQMLNSRSPLASTVIGSYVGDQIKGFVQNFVNALFGELSTFAQAVSYAFKVLGLIFKIQALILIYSESEAEVTLDPSIFHKPSSGPENRGAVVEVGIPDAAWEAAKQARQLSPFATAMRVCARFLGLPVWQDLVDVADAMRSWKVQWKVSRGGQHLTIPARDQFTSGRFERSLTKENDHRALDAITYDVRPERAQDHPGAEVTDTIELCAEVYPKAPPNGFSTLMSAYGAGTALAAGGLVGLVTAIGGLLTSWVSTIASIKDCGQATVSFHVPQPGAWHGTITVTTEVSSSITSVEQIYPGGVITASSRTQIDVTDRFYVSGNEEAAGVGFVMLAARQYTSGVGFDEANSVGTNIPRGCPYDFVNTQSSSGSWAFDGDTTATLMLSPDGSYRLGWAAIDSPEPVVMPGEEVNTVSIHEPSPHCVDIGSGTFDRDFYASPTNASAGSSQVEGRIDPANPGNVLRGSMTFGDPLSTTRVEWNLVHAGPIRLPGS